ncbi:MAG: threonine/serine dehydratase [Desulfobacterales bacterium]|jgi:threonine dehydratase
MIDIKQEVLLAEKQIRPYIRETPLDYSFYFSKLANCRVFLKLENLQHTGSFKARGAINKLLDLKPTQKKAGVVVASTGNHGLAVAHALDLLNISGTIFLPENVSPQKVQMLRNYDIEMKYYGTDCGDTEAHARAEAHRYGKIYVSPYNDSKIIGGQGTIGYEVFKQLESIDVIMISVGGGGLIAGIAGYLKAIKTDITIIGCLPQNSPVMYESIKAGHIMNLPISPTLSDGTAGSIENEAITFEPCRKYVDDWVLVDENEIRQGIRLVFEQHRQIIEGAAGVVVAAFLKTKEKLKNKNVVLVICGGNIDLNTFKEIVFRE